MSVSLANKVKYNKVFYNIYYYVGSTLIYLLKKFVKTDDKLIVFSVFGGKRFDDSPKAIYEQMLKDYRFDGYKLVWAFINPEDFNLPDGEKIKIDTFKYYKTVLKARVWITNTSMSRGLTFTGKHTYFLNTWHGTPIKKMGTDVIKEAFSSKKRKSYYDILAQGEFEAKIFSRVWNIPIEYFHIIGYPRNDELYTNNTAEYQNKLKKDFSISTDKKVILYAPTYREYFRDSGNNVILKPPVDFEKWQNILGSDYIVLFRAHHEVSKVLNIKYNQFIKNVSDYPNLNELMLMSDILISDYSSIIFDYSIMNKPMLVFCYDYEEYAANRGMYFDIREELQCENIFSEDALLKEIKNINIPYRKEISANFCKKYLQTFGNASQSACDLIFEEINR